MADARKDLLLPFARPARTGARDTALEIVELPTTERGLAHLVWAHRADDAKLLEVLQRIPPVDRPTARIVLIRELGPARAAALATRAYGAAHSLAPSVPFQGAPVPSTIPSGVRYD